MWRITLSEDLVGESEPDGNDAGQGLKVQEYRVWADTGAAFLASRGGLEDLERASREDRRRSVAGAHKIGEVFGDDYPVEDKLGSGLSFGGSSG